MIFLTLCFVCFVNILASDVIKKYGIKFASLRNAVCNDGSDGIYWARFNESSADWIIFLQGGGGCYSDESCLQRFKDANTLMTSVGSPDTLTVGGMLSGDCEMNPTFCTANIVLIHYCTSDWWSGNARKQTKQMEGSSPFSFFGKNIISETIKDLALLHGLKNAKTVVLSGGSAGGVGSYSNSDDIGNLLKQLVGNIDYSIISDSGFFLDGPGFKEWPCTDSNFCNYEHRVRTGQFMWGLVGHKKCVEHYGEEDQWKCLVGYYLWPFIESRKMGLFYQFDMWQAWEDGIVRGKVSNMTSEEKDWVFNRGQFVEKIVDQINIVGWVQGCFGHGMLIDNDFYPKLTTNDGVSPQMAIEKFMKGGSPKSVDVCQEIKCNDNCPYGNMIPPK